MRLCSERRTSLLKHWLWRFRTISSQNDEARAKKRPRSGVIFELTGESRSIDRTERSPALRPRLRLGKVSFEIFPNYDVPHEFAAIFEPHDPSRGDENLARSRDGNQDRPDVKGLLVFDDREREVFQIFRNAKRSEPRISLETTATRVYGILPEKPEKIQTPPRQSRVPRNATRGEDFIRQRWKVQQDTRHATRRKFCRNHFRVIVHI